MVGFIDLFQFSWAVAFLRLATYGFIALDNTVLYEVRIELVFLNARNQPNSTTLHIATYYTVPVTLYTGQLQYGGVMIMAANRFTSVAYPMRHRAVVDSCKLVDAPCSGGAGIA